LFDACNSIKENALLKKIWQTKVDLISNQEAKGAINSQIDNIATYE